MGTQAVEPTSLLYSSLSRRRYITAGALLGPPRLSASSARSDHRPRGASCFPRPRRLVPSVAQFALRADALESLHRLVYLRVVRLMGCVCTQSRTRSGKPSGAQPAQEADISAAAMASHEASSPRSSASPKVVSSADEITAPGSTASSRRDSRVAENERGRSACLDHSQRLCRVADQSYGGRDELHVVLCDSSVWQDQRILKADAHIMSRSRTGGHDAPGRHAVAMP